MFQCIYIRNYFERQRRVIIWHVFLSDNRVGTELILDVDWADFLSKLQESGHYESILNTGNGVFDYDGILRDIKKCLTRYIGEVIPNRNGHLIKHKYGDFRLSEF